MANDHYVAITYLKHFGDPEINGRLHGYKKSSGEYFQCSPKDVCREWGGDLNPRFFQDPSLLGVYRKLFEPQWNYAIENILNGKMTYEDKFIVSAYMANLMVCTPAWRRVGTQSHNSMMQGFLTIKKRFNEKHGKLDPLLKEGIELLETGEIELETDPDYIKALITKSLLGYAIANFNQDWEVIHNTTDFPFFTSDNPVGIEYTGLFGAPLIRYLPITLRLCLKVTYGLVDKPLETPDEIRDAIQRSPKGRITSVNASPALAKHINMHILKSAESLIFSNHHSTLNPELVKKYSTFQVDSDYVEIPANDGAIYQGMVIKVKQTRVI